MTKSPSDYTDAQLLSAIRRIEDSPSQHRGITIQRMVDDHLRDLRDEATARGLTPNALRAVRRLSRGTVV